jgi:hypothetical protein
MLVMLMLMLMLG